MYRVVTPRVCAAGALEAMPFPPRYRLSEIPSQNLTDFLVVVTVILLVSLASPCIQMVWSSMRSKTKTVVVHWLAPKLLVMGQRCVFPCLRAFEIGGHSISAHKKGLQTIITRAKAGVPLTKTCQCGAVTIEAFGGARHVFTCHCTTCANQTKIFNGKAPTWTAVSRKECTIRGEYNVYASSLIGRRGVCATCDDALFIDYSAKNTYYVANAVPTPPISTDSAAVGEIEFTADADIFWKDRKFDAVQTAPVQFDAMPLGKMGFVTDPGRDLEELQDVTCHQSTWARSSQSLEFRTTKSRCAPRSPLG